MEAGFSDLHTHNQLCNHATGTIQEYIQSAIKKGLQEIGISDHWPMKSLPNADITQAYAMNLDEVAEYIKSIKKMKIRFENQINVKIATEVDFCSEVFEEYKKQLKPYHSQFDYIIGAIHNIKVANQRYILIQAPNHPDVFNTYGVEQFYHKYYDELKKLIQSDYFHIIAHFDLPKKYGVAPSINLRQKILSILDLVKENHIAIEINTSGIQKPNVKEQYPADWILKECIKREIYLTFGSDAHQPEDVAFKFPKIRKKLLHWEEKYAKPINLISFSQQKRYFIPFHSDE